MPDTSAAGSDWAGWGTAASAFAIGILAWLGKWHAGKDQAKSPVTPIPEAAGVTMALIDAKVQAEIARDTQRTADACDALVEVVTTFIKESEEREEEREKQEARDRVDKAEREADRAERENEALRRQLEEARRNAGAYTTTPRPKDLFRDE